MPTTTEATPPLPGLSPIDGKPIIARFDGGALSSDGGLLALSEIEERLSIARHLAACIEDPRAPDRIQHSLADLLRFRLLIMRGRISVPWPPVCGPSAPTSRINNSG